MTATGPLRLSALVGRVGESATMKVARRALELQAAGVDVVDLSVGEPDADSPAVAIEAAKSALDGGLTRYTPVAGLSGLRGALAERYRREYGAPWSSSQVVVTVGAKAALLELVLALCDPGDEVIVPAPYWVTIPEQVRIAGGVPVEARSEAADGFRQHAAPVLEAMTERTRGVILNSPSNPTGGTLAAAELRRIVEAAAERGLWVISDETYERFVYDGATHASAAALAEEFPQTVILVGSFSKTYAMTGWRVGYAIAPPAVAGAVAALQSHATSNPTSFAMAGALAALEGAEPEVLEMIDEYAARRALVARLLDGIPQMSCAPPEGAFYVFPELPEAALADAGGSVGFAERLLESARVAVVPGIAFGDDRHVRISFAASRERIEEGFGRIGRMLAAG